MKELPVNLDGWIGQKIGCKDFTKDDLAVYQLTALKEVLKRASLDSPYYREKLAGFSPESLKTLADLEKLPLTDEADLKKEAMGFLAVNQKKVKRIVTLNSSGTTGLSKRVFFTDKDLDLTIDFFKNGMALFTKKGDRVLILMPGKTPASIGDLLKKALSQLGAEAIIYGVVDDPKKVSKLILDERITGLVGIPQQVLSVSMEGQARQIKAAKHLRSVLLSTDYVSPSLASKIQSQWGVSLYEHYGSTEMGYGGGVFCHEKLGYHLREADFYFEIVDPLTGKAVPRGVSGEVVFTTLTRQAMPLIRYRTGDISRFIDQACPCRTHLKTMERIAYRAENKVAVGEKSDLTLSFLEDLVFSVAGLADFRVVLEDLEKNRPGKPGRDHLQIELVFKENGSEAEKEQITIAVKDRLEAALREKDQEKSALVISVSQGRPGKVDLKGMDKRKIIDRRSSHE